jgi:hypothetical protein
VLCCQRYAYILCHLTIRRIAQARNSIHHPFTPPVPPLSQIAGGYLTSHRIPNGHQPVAQDSGNPEPQNLHIRTVPLRTGCSAADRSRRVMLRPSFFHPVR